MATTLETQSMDYHGSSWQKTHLIKNGVDTLSNVVNPYSAIIGYRNSSRTSTTTPRGLRSPFWTNNFLFSETETRYTFGWWRRDYQTYPLSGKSNWTDKVGLMDFNSPNALDGLTTAEKYAVKSTARNKMLLKIKDQKINLGQVYGEREQTVRLLTTAVSRLGKAISALRRGDYLGAARALGLSNPRGGRNYARRFHNNQQQAVASGWLELQYGWLPLLSDVYGSMDFYNKKTIGPQTVIRVSARNRKESRKVVLSAGSETNTVTTYQTLYEVSYVCYFKISQQPLKTLSELGIVNPLYLAWELLPFSFVADWFIPIGNFLSALDATLGVSYVGGCETTFQRNLATIETTGNGKRTYLPGYNHYNCFTGSYSSSQSNVACGRISNPDFPLPLLPTFKNPLSVTHFYNALALLVTTSRK